MWWGIKLSRLQIIIMRSYPAGSRPPEYSHSYLHFLSLPNQVINILLFVRHALAPTGSAFWHFGIDTADWTHEVVSVDRALLLSVPAVIITRVRRCARLARLCLLSLLEQSVANLLDVDFLLHPRMLPYLLESRPLWGSWTQHFYYKVAELPRYIGNAHFRPILLQMSLFNKLEVHIAIARFLEGEDSVDYYEENDGSWEYVHLPAVVGKPLFDLWCHVRLRPLITMQFLNAFVSCKAEIDDFQVHFSINQNILQLEISMYDAFFVHVLNPLNQLLHKKATRILAHSTQFFASFKENVAFDMLHDNVDQVLDFSSGWLDYEALWTVVQDTHNMIVLQATQYFDFLLNTVDVFLSLQ